MQPLAIALEQLCSAATVRVVLVAPFAKQAVVSHLLGKVPVGVRTDVVVRWLPYDIKSGVSDLEVWDAVRARKASRLFVRSDLHAKYYRSDSSCFVGSANLTAAALGLSAAPNFELLLPVDSARLEVFEADLFSAAVEVDDDLVALTRAAVERLPDRVYVQAEPDLAPSGGSVRAVRAVANWVPTLRQPEELFVAYAGEDAELSTVARLSAENDLAALRIPPRLDEEAFRACVGASLLRMPVISSVDRFIRESRRFGEVTNLLRERVGGTEPANRQWQLLLRWLTYFLPDRFEYARPHHSEVIRRRVAGD
jgi:hypothetical protein